MGLSKEYSERTRYSEELKKRVAFEVMSGSMTKREACIAYGVSDVKSVRRAIDKYGAGILSEHKDLLGQMGSPRKKTKPKQPDEAAGEAEELRRRIRELEHELDAARLRAEAYSLMIDLAEKELKVAIRKKSDTK